MKYSLRFFPHKFAPGKGRGGNKKIFALRARLLLFAFLAECLVARLVFILFLKFIITFIRSLFIHPSSFKNLEVIHPWQFILLTFSIQNYSFFLMIFMSLLIVMYVYFFLEFIINLIFSLLLFLFAHLSFIPSPELGTLELDTFYPDHLI